MVTLFVEVFSVLCCVNVQVGVGDFVSVCPENETEAVYIAQIIALWEDVSCNYRKQFHARWFSRSSDTVLGEVRHFTCT